MKPHCEYGRVAVIFLVAFVGTAPAAAQDGVYLEEIVVTATRRAESVQDIPVAVNVLTGDDLAKAGVTDIRGLVALAPSFYLTTTSSEVAGTTARIRGVGTQGNNPGLESAVGMYVDGVFRSRSTVGFTDLGEVERIEVLRGPQGTLFGRNSSAGVLSVVTSAPQFQTPQAYLRFSAGNYGLAKVQAGLDGPLSDRFAGGLDLMYTKRDGYFENDALTGQDFNTRDRYSLRAQLVSNPDDDVDIRIIADYATKDERCCGAVYTVKGVRTTLSLESLDPTRVDTSDADRIFARQTFTTPGRGYDTEVDEYGLSAEIDWDLGESKLVSITSYRDWDAKSGGDLDYSGADILYRNPDEFGQIFETFTQELRLNGEAGAVDWLVGAFYIDEKLDFTVGTKAGADYSNFSENLIGLFSGGFFPDYTNIAGQDISVDGGDGANDRFVTDSISYAFFTHNTWSITDVFRATLGLRYTSEEKEFSGTISTVGDACANFLAAAGFTQNGDPIVPVIAGSGALTSIVGALNCLGGTLNSTLDGSYSDSRDADNVSGTFALSWDVAENAMLFGSFSRGYKSGGYNLDRSGLDPNTVLNAGAANSTVFDITTDVNALEFGDEEVDAYEVGVKTTLASGNVNLNATYFHEDFSNFQLNTFNGLTFFVVTLDEVISEGVEVELKSRLTDSFRLDGGVVYNKAEYAGDVQRSDGQPAANLAGQQLTHAPEYSVTGSASYERELPFFGGALGFAHLDFRWTDEMNTGSDLDEEKIQEAFTVVNARLGIGQSDGNWNVELWAHNLLDEEYFQVVFDTPVQNTAGNQVLESYSAFLGEPRTYGLSVNFNFE